MNARRRLQREILRHRRQRDWWPPRTVTRFTTPNGVPVRVSPSDLHAHGWGPTYRATYFVPGAHVFGPWPPTPDLIRELGRWA